MNINKDKNLPLQKKCKPLYDYIQFTSRINENKKTMTIEDAVDEAVNWACEQNLLEGYIREQKAEVKMSLLTEYNEEASIKGWREDGIIEGRQQKAEEVAIELFQTDLPLEKIAKYVKLPLERVLELQKTITVEA